MDSARTKRGTRSSSKTFEESNIYNNKAIRDLVELFRPHLETRTLAKTWCHLLTNLSSFPMLHIELKTKFPIIDWEPHCVPKELMATYDVPPPLEFDWGRQEPLMEQYPTMGKRGPSRLDFGYQGPRPYADWGMFASPGPHRYPGQHQYSPYHSA
jgi:hypothetical protein